MPKRLSIVEIFEAPAPLREPVTKFGGQPVWLAEPTWPVSPRLGEPMHFGAQIRLPVEVVGEHLADRMAYVFVTYGQTPEGSFVMGGAPGDGEHAVIIQPGIDPTCRTIPTATGPSTFTWDAKGPRDPEGRLARRIEEHGVRLEWGEDPDYVPEGVIWGWDYLGVSEELAEGWPQEQKDRYDQAIAGSKIGGTPNFLLGDAWPEGEDWFLLLQIEAEDVLHCGPHASGYLFLSRDGTRSEYITQS